MSRFKSIGLVALLVMLFSIQQYIHEGLAFDFIKKAISPVKYWGEETARREEMVEFYRKQVTACNLELKKLRQTRNIIVRQNILAGMSREEARQEFACEWEDIKVTCQLFRGLYDSEKAELKQAHVELEKARGSQ